MSKPYKYKLPKGFHNANNIADHLKDDVLDEMGAELLQQVKDDINSRKDWLEANDKWMELVTQVITEKTYPWPKASNIKFPLISTAAVQFHSRAFPALLSGNRPIKCRVIGRDPKNLKAERAERLSVFLSWQLTEGMEDWVGDMDRLLFILPIIGSLYKKTYYHEAKRQIVSDMIHPRDLIINYDAIEVKDARKTHRLWMLPNTIKEWQNRGIYREIPNEDEFPVQAPKVHSEPRDKAQGLNNSGKADDYSLQELYEVHCLWDLDNDGYKEPYVCTIRAHDGMVYRLVANYDESTIERDGDNIIAIEPNDYYTHYFFMPDPESKTHGLGFGTMVGPINEAVNTLINILTDSGHMHSLGGGFMSRGVRLKGGATKFRPNEWKQVNTTGDDLRKGILPLPTKEPSMVLFQLLGLMIDSGKDLSSVQDQMVGKSPGQNTPFSTTQTVLEQGMKVFNGIYKRVYRSMTKEYKKIFKLNVDFPDVDSYMNVLDMEGMDTQEAAGQPAVGEDKPRGMQAVMQFLAADFKSEDLDVIPTAEPDMVAEVDKHMRVQGLLEMRQQGIQLNMQEVTKRMLEAQGHENVAELMKVPEPAPDPKQVLEEARFEFEKQIETLKAKSKQLLDMAQVGKIEAESKLAFATAQKLDVKDLHVQFMAEQKEIRDEYDAVTKRLKVLFDGRDRAKAQSTTGTSGSN